jgi:hypothetical protein
MICILAKKLQRERERKLGPAGSALAAAEFEMLVSKPFWRDIKSPHLQRGFDIALRIYARAAVQNTTIYLLQVTGLGSFQVNRKRFTSSEKKFVLMWFTDQYLIKQLLLHWQRDFNVYESILPHEMQSVIPLEAQITKLSILNLALTASAAHRIWLTTSCHSLAFEIQPLQITIFIRIH